MTDAREIVRSIVRPLCSRLLIPLLRSCQCTLTVNDKSGQFRQQKRLSVPHFFVMLMQGLSNSCRNPVVEPSRLTLNAE
jgi:hypothetical protein